MSLCAASVPSLIGVKSLWTVDGLGKPPLVCPVYGMRGRDWLMANGECSRRCPKNCRCPRSGRQHFLYSCSHPSSTSISSPAPHPPPIWSTGLATKTGRAQRLGDPKSPKLTQPGSLRAPVNPSHPSCLQPHRWHLLPGRQRPSNCPERSSLLQATSRPSARITF